MKDFIAYCGLDCERCEVRLATVSGDSTMIEKVAKRWSELNGVEITPAMIHCTGCRMTVISFHESDRQEHWLEEIKRSDWGAGAFLYELLRGGTFFEAVGEGSRVLLLTDGDELISYCTYARFDDIQPTELSPWMGFIYTFPEHRGHRYAGLLFAEVERIAREEGVEQVYISTNHIGLYEKYGCDFLTMMNDMDGKPSRVYVKRQNPGNKE